MIKNKEGPNKRQPTAILRNLLKPTIVYDFMAHPIHRKEIYIYPLRLLMPLQACCFTFYYGHGQTRAHHLCDGQLHKNVCPRWFNFTSVKSGR